MEHACHSNFFFCQLKHFSTHYYFKSQCSLIIICFFRWHYKEYLVHKINRATVDPVELYNAYQVKLILKREEIEHPDQDDYEGDDDYKAKLIEVMRYTVHLRDV